MFVWAFARASAVVLVTLTAGVAVAQEPKKQGPHPFTAEDIVRSFSQPAAEGGSRQVCIGTESECRAKVGVSSAANAAPYLDLLINFDYNSDRLTTTAKQNLDVFAKALRDPALASKQFVLEGHTDATGTPEYNLELSTRRADAALRYLADKGVSNSTVTSKGLGASRPRVPDPQDPSNRRVEARLAE